MRKQFSPLFIFHFSEINFHLVSTYNIHSINMASLRKRDTLMNTSSLSEAGAFQTSQVWG